MTSLSFMVFLKTNSCRLDVYIIKYADFEFLGLASSDQSAKRIYWKNFTRIVKRFWFRLSSFLVSSLPLPFWSSWIIFILWNGTWLSRTWVLISHPTTQRRGNSSGLPYFTYRERNCGAFFAAGFSLNSSARSKVFVESELLKAPEVRWNTITVPCLVFWDPSEWRIFPNPQLWLLNSMKDHIEQTKDPSHKSHHNPRLQNAAFLACAATLLQHTLTFSEGAIVKLNVSSRERRCWKWSQFLLTTKDWCYE